MAEHVQRHRPALVLSAITAAILALGLGVGWVLQRYDTVQAFGVESERIAYVLKLAPGVNVGDIRAGDGRWTVAMAARVAPDGQVYATVGPNPAHELLETVAKSRLDNVTVITRTPEASPRLPIGCCEAILVRGVYHEFADRRRFVEALGVNLKPGGLVAVIDYDEHTPEAAAGHGIARAQVVSEFRAGGFEVVQVFPTWFGDAYCVLFRRSANASQGPTEAGPTPGQGGE